jgi:spore maturation protein CgeB
MKVLLQVFPRIMYRCAIMYPLFYVFFFLNVHWDYLWTRAVTSSLVCNLSFYAMSLICILCTLYYMISVSALCLRYQLEEKKLAFQLLFFFLFGLRKVRVSISFSP